MDKISLLALIEQKLNILVPMQQCPYGSLFAAARYSLLSGGKRLRPLLLVATVATLKGDIEKALSSACALEMIHTYSLIHDDLPCMDDDDFRRSKPTLHRAFPEAHAVLAGDFLLTQAFETIATDAFLQDAEKAQIILLLARKSGSQGMIAGQIMDIEAEGQKVSLEQLKMIHHYKTGQLITAALEIGGLIAAAKEEQQALLRNYGNCIGLAFQITDDILDVTSSEKKHGKKLSSDSINNKTTYATLLGIAEAKAQAQELVDAAKKALEKLTPGNRLLYDIADSILTRDH